jgi:hypothetical protein
VIQEPRLRAETLRPDDPRLRYSISIEGEALVDRAAAGERLHAVSKAAAVCWRDGEAWALG